MGSDCIFIATVGEEKIGHMEVLYSVDAAS